MDRLERRREVETRIKVLIAKRETAKSVRAIDEELRDLRDELQTLNRSLLSHDMALAIQMSRT